LVNDDLVRKVNERVRDDRRFTISDLSLHFPQISWTLFYVIVSSHLGRRRPHSMRRVYKVCVCVCVCIYIYIYIYTVYGTFMDSKEKIKLVCIFFLLEQNL